MTPPPFPRLTGAEPCRTGDPERWFPDPRSVHANNRAKRECNPCPVRQACFAWAVHRTVEGIFGGSTEAERRVIQRRNAIVPTTILQDWDAAGSTRRTA